MHVYVEMIRLYNTIIYVYLELPLRILVNFYLARGLNTTMPRIYIYLYIYLSKRYLGDDVLIQIIRFKKDEIYKGDEHEYKQDSWIYLQMTLSIQGYYK